MALDTQTLIAKAIQQGKLTELCTRFDDMLDAGDMILKGCDDPNIQEIMPGLVVNLLEKQSLIATDLS